MKSLENYFEKVNENVKEFSESNQYIEEQLLYQTESHITWIDSLLDMLNRRSILVGLYEDM